MFTEDMAATTTNDREVTMFSTIQPGLLPAGTKVPGFGTIVRSSYTAYLVEWTEPCTYGTQRREEWLPFHHVHGKPEPVEPLVVFA